MWVLIILMASSKGLAISTQEFSTELARRDAFQAIKKVKLVELSPRVYTVRNGKVISCSLTQMMI